MLNCYEYVLLQQSYEFLGVNGLVREGILLFDLFPKEDIYLHHNHHKYVHYDVQESILRAQILILS